MIFSNVDEEIEKLNEIKKLCESINTLEADKLFIGKAQLAEMLNCSERAAGEFMNLPGFPVIKIGSSPMVNVFALCDFTRQRIVLSEMKK